MPTGNFSLNIFKNLNVFCVLWFFLHLLVALVSARPTVILSEVMADPNAISDTHGEFIELANISDSMLHFDSLLITVDDKSYWLKEINMKAHGFFLLCRDTLKSENGHLPCDRLLSNLSLSNSRPMVISIGSNLFDTVTYALPTSLSGKSWENTFEQSAEFKSFASALHANLSGDFATPGLRNSQSREAAKFDLAIVQASLDSNGYLLCDLENKGSEAARETYLTLRLDNDGDGISETFIDSVLIQKGNEKKFRQQTFVGHQLQGIVHLTLGEDENIQNNFFQLLLAQSSPLKITEWCPVPDSDGVEWVEIKNSTADSGGSGTKWNLSQLKLNGVMLGLKTSASLLNSGEYLVLTQSIAKFQKQFGMLKVRVLELPTWPSLRNTGDTIKLTMDSWTLDEVHYGPQTMSSKGNCFTRTGSGIALFTKNGLSTPGFAATNSPVLTDDFSWNFSSKKVSSENAMQIEIIAPSNFNYAIRVFNQEGILIKDLGIGSEGNKSVSWDGTDRFGETVLRGPYIICLTSPSHRTRRQVVIAL